MRTKANKSNEHDRQLNSLRVNKARKERDEFERQVRSITEKLHKSHLQRRALKEASAADKQARFKVQKEHNELLLKVTLERENQAREIDSIR